MWKVPETKGNELVGIWNVLSNLPHFLVCINWNVHLARLGSPTLDKAWQFVYMYIICDNQVAFSKHKYCKVNVAIPP